MGGTLAARDGVTALFGNLPDGTGGTAEKYDNAISYLRIQPDKLKGRSSQETRRE